MEVGDTKALLEERIGSARRDQGALLDERKGLLRDEAAESPAVVEQWASSMPVVDVHVGHAPEYDLMITCVVYEQEVALEPGEHSVETRRSVSPGPPTDPGEFVTPRDSELPRQRFLILSQDVDAEETDRCYARPARGALSRGQSDHGRIQRKRRERLARESDRPDVLRGCDDGYASCEVPEHLAKSSCVES